VLFVLDGGSNGRFFGYVVYVGFLVMWILCFGRSEM
jgi:hypothetical protein